MPRSERQRRRLVISIRDLPGFDDVRDVPEEELEGSIPGESLDPFLDPPVSVNFVRITVDGGAGASPPPAPPWWKRTAVLVGASVSFLATLTGVLAFFFGPYAARDVDELTVVVSQAAAAHGLYRATLVFNNSGTRPGTVLETRLRYAYADGIVEGREARTPTHPAFTVPARESRIERVAIPYKTRDLMGMSDDYVARHGTFELVLELVVIDADGGRHTASHHPISVDPLTGFVHFPAGYDAEQPIPLL